MSTAAEYISASVSKEQGLSFKNNKLFARRTIPGSAGLQTKELSWGIKDYDGSHFSLRPDDFPQAKRLVARGKAVRDLEAMLTSSVGAGAQAMDILRAFNLVYWLVPTVERQSSDSAKHADISRVGQLVCHKTSGHPLEGFSGCSANGVWAGLPHPLHQAIACWLKGHYYRVKSGRSNEYQLAARDVEDPAFKQQQLAAFPCLPQLEMIIALLELYSQRSMIDPTGLSHLKLSDSLTDVQLKLCEQFIINPEACPVQLPVSPVQLPVRQQQACTGPHILRCHIHGPGVRPHLVEQGFLDIQEKLDMSQHQLIKNEDDFFNTMWLEGHAGPGSLLLDLTLVATSFPTMAELLIAAKALRMALQQALLQEQYFPGAVGFTILLNDHLAMVKESELGSTRLQRVSHSIVPVVTFATADGDLIKLVGENLLSSTTFSAKLPGKFTSYPLRVLEREMLPTAQKVTLTFPECLRSVTAAEIQLEACHGHYKSVQTRLSQEPAAASSHPHELQAVQFTNQSVPELLMDRAVSQGKWQSSGSPAMQGCTQGIEPDATQSDAVFCASCQQQVAQERAKHRLPALGQYGWFCRKCQGRATLRGAILWILGRKRRTGATFADLKEDLEQYRRSTARKSKSGEYGLLGDAIPEKSQLAWMVDGQDGKNIGLPALVKKLPHENRLSILYTLALQEGKSHLPLHSHSAEHISAEALTQDDAAEPSGESSSACSLRSHSVESDAAGAMGPSQNMHSDKLEQALWLDKLEQARWLAKLDGLQCSICNGTEGEKDFLLCDSCAQGYHAGCLDQELPSTRFWWCPDCSRRGLTIKGLILQVVEESGDKGLTAAEVTEQVLARRPRGTYPPSVRGERSRLVNGVSGKMVNGHPVLERIGEGRYRLAPDPDFTDPDTLPSHVTVATGCTEEPLPTPASITPPAADAPATGAAAQSFLASEISRSAATTAAVQLVRAGAENATAARSASLSASPAGAASTATASNSPPVMTQLQHSAAAQTSAASVARKAAEAVGKECGRGLLAEAASPSRLHASRRYIDVTVPGAAPVQSSGPKKAASGHKRPRSAAGPHQTASLKAQLVSGSRSAVKQSFDPARELLERTTMPPADLACTRVQHDTQSLADLIPEQVRAHQGAAEQTGLTAAAKPLGCHQQPGFHPGTLSACLPGNKGKHGTSSGAKQNRNKFCLDSDSDEEPADQPEISRLKALLPEHSRREVVAPFSLRSSHQGPADKKQVTVWEMGQVYQGSNLQHLGKLVDGTYQYQYPVGYKAVMQVHSKSTRCLDWTLDVQVVDGAPRFQVTNEMGYEYAAPLEATKDNKMMGLRGACDFGLQDETVAQAVEQMYALKAQRVNQGQGLVETASAPAAPDINHNASVSHCSAPSRQHMSGTVSKGHGGEPEQPKNLQHVTNVMEHVSDGGDESTASDMGMEVDDGAEQAHTAHEPASAQKAPLNHADNTVTVADSLPNEDVAVLLAKKPDHDALMPSGVSTLLQRLHVMDAASAPLDEIEEGITQLLSCFPETEELEGYFSGWMMNMSMTDDNGWQLRIRGIFADIQFVASHVPDAQAGSLQMLLQALLEGLQR